VYEKRTKGFQFRSEQGVNFGGPQEKIFSGFRPKCYYESRAKDALNAAS
jgi:hypothetical protein